MPGEEEGIAALARVLGHETCVRLIDALGAGESTVSDLACRLDLDQPRVSTHLGLMREAGLVDCRASGRQRVCALGRQGVNLPLARRSRRALAIHCADWTERRPHLGGALGAALLAAMLDQGRVRLRPGGRALDLEAGEPDRFLEVR